jgi:hypothetical protein
MYFLLQCLPIILFLTFNYKKTYLCLIDIIKFFREECCILYYTKGFLATIYSIFYLIYVLLIIYNIFISLSIFIEDFIFLSSSSPIIGEDAFMGAEHAGTPIGSPSNGSPSPSPGEGPSTLEPHKSILLQKCEMQYNILQGGSSGALGYDDQKHPINARLNLDEQAEVAIRYEKAGCPGSYQVRMTRAGINKIHYINSGRRVYMTSILLDAIRSGESQ